MFQSTSPESLREENIDISGLDVSFDLGTVGVLVLFEADGQVSSGVSLSD